MISDALNGLHRPLNLPRSAQRPKRVFVTHFRLGCLSLLLMSWFSRSEAQVITTEKDSISFTNRYFKPASGLLPGTVVGEFGTGLVLAGDSSSLTYTAGKFMWEEPIHFLKTSRRAPFHLLFPKGTRIDVNYDTYICYSAQMEPHHKYVELKDGEIHIVASKSLTGLSVNLIHYGTLTLSAGASVDIKAYHWMSTPLIAVISKRATFQWQGEEFHLKKGDMVKLVGPKAYVIRDGASHSPDAWSSANLFVFSDQLPDVLRELSAWYDVPVKNAGDGEGYALHVHLPRNGPLQSYVDFIDRCLDKSKCGSVGYTEAGIDLKFIRHPNLSKNSGERTVDTAIDKMRKGWPRK